MASLPEPARSPFSADNTKTVLGNVFGIVTDYGHQRVKDDLINISRIDPEYPWYGFTFVFEDDQIDNKGVRTNYSCVDGGSLEHKSDISLTINLTFTNCSISGVVHNGYVEIESIGIFGKL